MNTKTNEIEEIVEEPSHGRSFGKTSKILFDFYYSGKDGKATCLVTQEGNFLSPKAVENLLSNTRKEYEQEFKDKVIRELFPDRYPSLSMEDGKRLLENLFALKQN